MIEGQLVKINFLVNIDTGEIISTPLNYNDKDEYKRDFSFRNLKTWVRVKFIDLDETFVGEVEKVERNTWSEVVINILKKGEQVTFNTERVIAVEDKNKDFCYSDDVTQCSCPGACRNK
jgi:hypothetical protein